MLGADGKKRRSKDSHKDDKGGVEMTRFGPADAEFTFKLSKCRIFSFSNVNKKRDKKKVRSDLSQRLFGTSPAKKRK